MAASTPSADAASKPKTDAYFSERKGEVNELRNLLRNPEVERDAEKKREVIKRVIHYMTLGIDMSPLFSEMVMAVVTKDFIVKKLVYQYLCYYASTNEELTILVINTLRKDCKNENPMVRGLALRSLSSLRVPSVVEYLVPHISAGLTDASSYVRASAVMACLKLFHISPRAFRDNNYVDVLYEMLRDNDPTVAGNCVCTLNEILGSDGGIKINRAIIMFLLNRLSDFSEWHEMRVLELVRNYKPSSEEEMYDIMNLLEDRFKLAHVGVLLGVAAVFLRFSEERPQLHQDVARRLVDPLITQVSTASPEICYVCLCHARLLEERYPGLFCQHFKSFYFRHYDPLYVKLAKLEMLALTTNETSFSEIVPELGEYCGEMETCTAAVRTLTQATLRVPRALDAAIGILQELLTYDVPQMTQVIIVAIQELLRRYPSSYARFVPLLGRHFFSFDSVAAKEALLWIVGEFGEFISSSPYVVESFVDKVVQGAETSPSVKIQLLTAATKLFFKRPPEMQRILGRLLSELAEAPQVALRDRACLIYRALLLGQSMPDGLEQAKAMFLACKTSAPTALQECVQDSKEIFREFDSCSVLFGSVASHFIRVKLPRLSDEALSQTGPSAATSPAATVAAEAAVPAAAPPPQAPPAVVESEDLLRIASATVATAVRRAPPVLEATPEAVTAPQFQQMWGTFSLSEAAEEKLRPGRQAPSAAEIQQALLDAGSVVIMASGTLPGVIKFFLYARHAASGAHLLAEMQVLSDTLALRLKSDKPESAHALAVHLTSACASFLEPKSRA